MNKLRSEYAAAVKQLRKQSYMIIDQRSELTDYINLCGELRDQIGKLQKQQTDMEQALTDCLALAKRWEGAARKLDQERLKMVAEVIKWKEAAEALQEGKTL